MAAAAREAGQRCALLPLPLRGDHGRPLRGPPPSPARPSSRQTLQIWGRISHGLQGFRGSAHKRAAATRRATIRSRWVGIGPILLASRATGPLFSYKWLRVVAVGPRAPTSSRAAVRQASPALPPCSRCATGGRAPRAGQLARSAGTTAQGSWGPSVRAHTCVWARRDITLRRARSGEPARRRSADSGAACGRRRGVRGRVATNPCAPATARQPCSASQHPAAPTPAACWRT